MRFIVRPSIPWLQWSAQQFPTRSLRENTFSDRTCPLVLRLPSVMLPSCRVLWVHPIESIWDDTSGPNCLIAPAL